MIRKDWEVLCVIFKIYSLIQGQLQVFCIPGFQDREKQGSIAPTPPPFPRSLAKVEDLGLSTCHSGLKRGFCPRPGATGSTGWGPVGEMQDRAEVLGHPGDGCWVVPNDATPAGRGCSDSLAP